MPAHGKIGLSKRKFDTNVPLQLQHECPHLSTNRLIASFTGARSLVRMDRCYLDDHFLEGFLSTNSVTKSFPTLPPWQSHRRTARFYCIPVIGTLALYSNSIERRSFDCVFPSSLSVLLLYLNLALFLPLPPSYFLLPDPLFLRPLHLSFLQLRSPPLVLLVFFALLPFTPNRGLLQVIPRCFFGPPCFLPTFHGQKPFQTSLGPTFVLTSLCVSFKSRCTDCNLLSITPTFFRQCTSRAPSHSAPS